MGTPLFRYNTAQTGLRPLAKKKAAKCHQSSISSLQGPKDHVVATNRKAYSPGVLTSTPMLGDARLMQHPDAALRLPSIWVAETWPKSYQPFKVSFSEGNGLPRREEKGTGRWRIRYSRTNDRRDQITPIRSSSFMTKQLTRIY